VAGARHIVIATPLTPSTRHLVDRELLGRFTPGAHIVNIARGGIIDQDALRQALDDGTVACASLDTVDPEPLPEGHWLYTHPQVRLSPHVSWCVPSAMPLLYEMFAANLARYVAGEPLEGVVDRVQRY
jgi:phosphoglycerate dehydrogenase-like enzyme